MALLADFLWFYSILVNMKKRHVIIGTSAAAIGCINKLHSLDSESEIICISAESELPYNKCYLVDLWVGDKTKEQIATKKPDFFQENHIELLLGKRVVEIVCGQSKIVLDDEQTIPFDTLLIATGSRARKLEIPGFLRQASDYAEATTDRQDERGEGIFYFHTLDDTKRIMHYIQQNNPRNAVVIGSGFTGLEVADVLNQKGINTTVVERGDRVLGSFLNERESEIVQVAMKERGVEFLGDEEVEEINNIHSYPSTGSGRSVCSEAQSFSARGDLSIDSRLKAPSKGAHPELVEGVEPYGRCKAIKLKSGKTVTSDLIIIAIGVLPNSELALQAGIELHKGGIKTNEYLQTSISNIFAAGDVATVKDHISGQSVRSCMWADAMQQGMIAAHGMVGISKEYPGVMTTGISHFFGLDIMLSGSNVATGQEHIYQTGQSYRKFILKDGILKAFTMIGKLEKVGIARRALMTQIPVDQKELE